MEGTVGIVGASGWLGRHLVNKLIERGDQVVGYSRSVRPEKNGVSWRQWDGSGEIDLGGVEAIINLAGESIDQRWTGQKKESFRESRVALTENLVSSLKNSEVRALLNASAVGIYGDRGDEKLSENVPPGNGFLAGLCHDWEQAAKTEEARVCMLRTGVVLGRGGGAWPKVRKIFNFGFGGRLGNGRQWMPWIHLEDEISAILHCLDHEVSGPVNLVAPESVRNIEFTKTVGQALGRLTIFPAPEFMLRLILGEFADEGLLASTRAMPDRLQSEDFTFAYPDLSSALSQLEE